MTICGAASDYKVGIMTIIGFEWLCTMQMRPRTHKVHSTLHLCHAHRRVFFVSISDKSNCLIKRFACTNSMWHIMLEKIGFPSCWCFLYKFICHIITECFTLCNLVSGIYHVANTETCSHVSAIQNHIYTPATRCKQHSGEYSRSGRLAVVASVWYTVKPLI